MNAKKKKGQTTDGYTVITSIERVSNTGKLPYILFLSGPLVGKLHMLETGSTVMGRSKDNGIMLNDSRVSRRHIELIRDVEGVKVRDLGSTNGTFVNGQRIAEHLLEDGDKIQISSSTIFKFALQDETENIFHKELYKMAVKDAVTNIHNKRYFLERLQEELSISQRRNIALSLIMFDIDFFKKVNDTYGHLAGDMVLAEVARRVEETIREEDLLARYGGEEFAVLLRGIEEENAKVMAERMRKLIADTPIKFDNTEIDVTVSLGVATLTQETPYKTIEDMIQAADTCLYDSKHKGRNQVTTMSEYKRK